MRAPRSLDVLVVLTSAALGASLPIAAWAQGACNSSSDVPAYTYTEIFDGAAGLSLPIVPRMNDLGDVAILVPLDFEGGLNARRCLARHSDRVTRTVLCTQSVDPASDVNRLEATLHDLDLHINNRGAIAITGGRVGSSLHRVLVVPRNGPHTLSNFEGFPQAIDDDGNVAFQSGWPTFSLRGALAGGGFVDIAALGSFDVFGSSSPGGTLYFSGPSRITRIQNAFTGDPIVQSEASPGDAEPIDRAGGFAYSDKQGRIARRLTPFGSDATVIDLNDPAAPLLSFPGYAKLGCSVALRSTARGICRGGTRDRELCDPFPPGGGDECAPNGGFCERSVEGLFRWQSGPIVTLLREGDPLLGSTIVSFYTSSTIPNGFVDGNLAGQILFSVRLADGRNLLVRGDPAGASAASPVGPSSCAGPACSFAAQPSGFTGLGPAGVPIYVSFGGLSSPGGGAAGEVLVGFDYAVAPGSPRFASVQIPFPLPNGQEAFLLEVGAASFPLAAGEQFDLTSVDAAGVAGFSVRGIGTSEPVDPAAVVSGVTFVAEAPAELTVTAVVPEAGGAAAGAAALCALASLARRRRGG